MYQKSSRIQIFLSSRTQFSEFGIAMNFVEILPEFGSVASQGIVHDVEHIHPGNQRHENEEKDKENLFGSQ